MVGFPGFLLAGEANLLGVDNDNKIAGVNVRCKHGFVLSAKNIGDFYGDAAQYLIVRVDQMPVPFVDVNFWQIRFHVIPE